MFVIKKFKNTAPGTHLIEDFIDEEIIVAFHEQELQKTNQKSVDIIM